MKKALKIFSVFFLVGLFFTGCTPKKDKVKTQSEDPSGASVIDFEVPDKVDNYDFHYEFVPE